MKRSVGVAMALLSLASGLEPWTGAFAQFGGMPGMPGGPPAASSGPPPGQSVCAKFPELSAEAKKKADLVQAAMKARAERSKICTLMTSFVASEGNVVKFLEDNKTWCGVPDEAIKTSKINHEKSIKFRNAACDPNAGGPTPKTPTLSDAIKLPSVDSATNTKTGRGTFDTLTGNPLAR